MMDEILSDTKMDRLDRIEKLEEVLNSVIARHQDMSSNNHSCFCNCHNENINHVPTAEVECQTLSTGDIVITNVFYENNSRDAEKTLIACVKK